MVIIKTHSARVTASQGCKTMHLLTAHGLALLVRARLQDYRESVHTWHKVQVWAMDVKPNASAHIKR